MPHEMSVKVERRPTIPQNEAPSIAAEKLFRNGIALRGDVPDSVARQIFFANIDVDKRNADRNRPHSFTVGITENLENLAIVNRMALGDVIPADLELLTEDAAGNFVSWRHFADLQFRSSSISYSVVGGRETPVHKITYDCVLADSWYYDRVTNPPRELYGERVRTFER